MGTKRKVAAAAIPAAAGLAGLWLITRKPQEMPGRVTLVRAPEATVIGRNGAVRSVQSARLAMPEADLQRLWTAANLENLGATYWAFLTKATLGMVRVLYSDTDRRVTVLGIRWLTLLRFDPPEFELEHTRAKISWQIQDGLLVASNGRAHGGLALEVKRDEPDGAAAASGAAGPRAELTIEVEVTNFYPAIASRLGDFVYRNTQAFIHVLVTQAFLRSLGGLKLHQSKVGKLLIGSPEPPENPA